MESIARFEVNFERCIYRLDAFMCEVIDRDSSLAPLRACLAYIAFYPPCRMCIFVLPRAERPLWSGNVDCTYCKADIHKRPLS